MTSEPARSGLAQSSLARPSPEKIGRHRSVRFRLLAIALLPTFVILPLLLGVTIVRWNAKFDQLLKSKVHGDLTIADQYFNRILETTGDEINALGRSAEFRDVVAAGAPDPLAAYLEKSRKTLGLDFLYLVSPGEGVRATSPPGASPSLSGDSPVVQSALSGKPTTAIDIFSGDELAAISPALAAQARLPLVDTPNAVPTERKAETRGMVVHSATPVRLAASGSAALVGGLLLNQNLVFIDTINDLVYRAESLPSGSQGTATLFLDDVRVSTNVRLFEDKRALGTRVSAAVRSAVLGEGRVWLDSAFVVNDWYISAYEPITDSFGRRVGMLYVGFLEAPFQRTKLVSLLTLIAAFAAVTALSVPLFLRWAGSVFRPLERMTETISKVEAGDMSARTALPDNEDEIARVAAHLDGLLNQVQERDRQLRSWNEELNARVAERTRELSEANRQLEATTRQLIMSEKLAAIGEITAGVAHEINNPVAVMQGNLEVVRSILGEAAVPAETEIRLIDEQIDRIGQIVTKLLQFARPEEYAGFVDRHAPSDVVADCLPLVQHLLNKAEIEVIRRDTATRLVLMNRTELQQVLVNLIVNAIHAMPEGGRLTIATSDEDRDATPGIQIAVEDTGIGIPPEVLSKIFDPFFTTKRREGTGLGLSISQTLIAQQGGALTVSSTPGEGTVFVIWLPEAR
ncbi:sensor histidine kinase [Afifella marina]|uniref:histidine kinase n=1 Tax=Afifella marina DSM 2698 TaxID=1120955 RepID=A0A1G5MYG6_AFIMA|nr:HAMP domain-containing sensor histidine kinase [Afifella marina]MBK1622124.1 two-component sensor histidine kinase [Afifella marina DSM 2698]MBK1628250.1 two-component sensor histidine kinase [Afifella marina]MBK5918908.1 two-component sensor histidine kinase [Afifella marina]RAI17769.1 two-component sensor histidine kinase [Afifella marina DSM 2698]SCZ29698.1 HAMP domain-containing protein [Afifella marina DSM 2698]